MTPADILAALEQEFGDKIKAKKTDAIDPYVVVDAADLAKVCRFLRDDSALQFDVLNCISGVDYLEPDPKKAPKAGFEPHLEVVYHLSSSSPRKAKPSDPGRIMRLVVKVLLPRWKDNKSGQLPEVTSVTSLWRTAEWHEREVYD